MNVAILFGRKNSKSIKNKNILKVFSKEMFMYPIEAAKKSKFIEKIYVSSDSNYILKKASNKGCEKITRPKYLCNDKALLEDAIQHAVNYCQNKNNHKIKNFVILLCNSICVRHIDIDKGFKILEKNKNFDTVTTVSKFNNFSPVRSKKINGKNLLNYIPNKTLKKFTPLSCDRDKSVHSYLCTQSFTISRAKIMEKMKKNPFPFNWMGKKSTYIIQDSCVGDIDFPWQLEATKWWIKKNSKKTK
jgi:CMP-N-acetylneuraminic acid synthetase